MGDTWAPREGAYGRTRDGQKVGPLTHGKYVKLFWEKHRSGGNDAEWAEDGRVLLPGPEEYGDLVAEWYDATRVDGSPVRTVTRREIVPGTYAGVSVRLRLHDPANVVAVSLFAHDEMHRPMTAAELDAAARVLTELAEALRDGK